MRDAPTPDIVENLVSTVIPVYNRPKMLQEAVGSVLAQTYRPIEVIISDDGSTDDTREVLEILERRHPEVSVVRNENRGPGPAREAGRSLARGEFIQYLDSDDLLRENKFKLQVDALRRHPDCGVAYGYACFHPVGGRPKPEPFKYTGKTLPTLFPHLLVDRWWTTNTPLYRRSVTDAAGPWSDLRWSQDWEYDGRIGARNTRLVHVKEFVCDWRSHAGPRQISPADWTEPFRARERRRFLGMLFTHAKTAGMTPKDPEMQHFSRWAFRFARICGAAGLAEDAEMCFQWALEAAGEPRSRGRDFRFYKRFTRLLGWTFTGRLAHALETRLRRTPGPATLKQSWAEGSGALPELMQNRNSS
jgi:glycosyltransferase involved in cell wall biosynthesis